MTDYSMSHLITKSLTTSNLEYLSIIPKHLLLPAEKDIVEFIFDYSRGYGDLPPEQLLTTKFLNWVPLDTGDVAIGYVADQVYPMLKRRYIKKRLLETKENQGDDALYDPEFLASLQHETIFEEHSVIDINDFDRTSYLRDVDPIHFNLDFFDSLNLSRGDFLVLFARLKSYKTFTLLLLAYKLYLEGERVLFYSQELSKIEIMQRLDAMIGKLNPSFFRGLLFNMEKDLAMKTLVDLNSKAKALNTKGTLKVIEGNSSINAIHSKIESLPADERPTAIFIDAFEHMASGNTVNSAERSINLGTLSYELKQIAVKYKLLMGVTTQANRQATADSADPATVAGSDNIARSCDLLLYGSKVDLDIVDDSGNPVTFSSWKVAASRHSVDQYEAYISFRFNEGKILIHKNLNTVTETDHFALEGNTDG